MTLHAYFDGSGTDHDPNIRVLTLAGYIGPLETWKELEDRWAAFLEEEKLPYFHSSEANARRGAFAGKSPQQIAMLRAGITLLMRDFNPANLYGILCSVSMDAHRALDPPLGISAPSLCADFCLKQACDHVVSALGEGGRFDLYFDADEKFFPELRNRWRNWSVRQQDAMLRRISMFSEAHWKETKALQAADYLGWCTTSQKAGSRLRRDMLTANLPIAYKHYGAEELAEIRKRIEQK